ncbi:MAG: cation-translocating P-type ATPase, partial [Bacteroidetes bacterium]|nr:cation-translocating P-type ATPase [Bacteroidota bacterium]
MANEVKSAETNPDATQWHQRSVADILNELGSTDAGLSAAEAAVRLAANGPNELHEGKRIGPWMIFLRQFKSVIIWVLIAAGVMSYFLGETVDAAAILTIVLLNAVIGFVQEYNSERSIAALKKMTAPQANVKRGGTVSSIAAVHIVQGDILVLAAGDLVPADARLLNVASLTCIEAPLTGESVPVEKKMDAPQQQQQHVQLGDRVNMVFMGTSVAGGTALAVVAETGMRTELGRIA